MRAGARRSAAGACPPKRSGAFPGPSGKPFDPGRRSVCRSIRIAFRRHRSSRSSPGFAGVSFTDRSRDRPVFVGAEAPAEFHSAPRSPGAFSTPSGSVKAEASGFRIRAFTDRSPSSPTVPKLAFWDPVRPSFRKASSPSRRPRRVRSGGDSPSLPKRSAMPRSGSFGITSVLSTSSAHPPCGLRAFGVVASRVSGPVPPRFRGLSFPATKWMLS